MAIQPIDNSGIQGMQQTLDNCVHDINEELVHARYAMGRGDFGAAFKAMNKVEKHAKSLVSANRHTVATLEGVLLAYANQETWIREFLECLEAIYPDVYELLMSAEISVQKND